MQELEKILEEIEHLEKIQFSSYTKPLITIEDVEKIIRKHMNDKSETYAFDFANTEAFDCPCGRHYVHLAIPPTTIYLWLIPLTASKELPILLLKLLE